MADITPEQQALIDEHVALFKNEQAFGEPLHFSVRRYIAALEARITELEGKKNAKGEKGGTAKTADKTD